MLLVFLKFFYLEFFNNIFYLSFKYYGSIMQENIRKKITLEMLISLIFIHAMFSENK